MNRDKIYADKYNQDDAYQILDGPKYIFKKAIEYTTPDFSLVFIVMIALGSFFHESHATATISVIAGWFILQFIGNVVDEDFKQDLFWNIIKSLSNVFLYLFIGHVWSYIKLYIDLSQGYLGPELTEAANKMDALDFVWEIKHLIAYWTVNWPLSICYTLTRDPFTIITNLVIRWTQHKYEWIIRSALQINGTPHQTDNYIILWYFGGMLGYFVIGYIWTHAKLFIDTWQGTLPPKLDAKLQKVYNGEGSWWVFILDIKWLIIQWMFTWPFSMLFTIFRHPIRIIVDFLYKLSQKKYILIIKKALSWREKEIENENENENE